MTDHALLREFAQRCKDLHYGDSGYAESSVFQEYIGKVGEDVFGLAFGYPINLELDRNGDGNIDFKTEIGTIDVKTYEKAYHLPLKVGDKVPDILVLAKYYRKGDYALLLGWQYGNVVEQYPIGALPGQTILNHLCPAKDLRKMRQLKQLFDQKKG